MNPVLILIFSKDRPMQLDCCLESISKYVSGRFVIYCIVKHTSDKYYKGYRKVKFRYKNVHFHRETDNFKDDVSSLVQNPFFDHCLFMVDDSVFFKKVNLNSLLPIQDDTIGVSLRIGVNTRVCYMSGKEQSVPNNAIFPKYCKWDWTKEKGDLGYPLELSSSLYPTSTLTAILSKIQFKSPNTLEYEMHKSIQNINKPYMKSVLNQVCVSVPLNQVQTDWVLPNMKIKASELLTKYVDHNQKMYYKFDKVYATHIDLEPRYMSRV